jgi:alpha-galactosidase
MPSELADGASTQAVCFPDRPPAAGYERTTLVMEPETGRLPVVRWLGALPHTARPSRHPTAQDLLSEGTLPDGAAYGAPWAAAAGPWRGCPLLIEHSRGAYTRPGLRGHRLAAGPPSAGQVAGRDWSPAFQPSSVTTSADRFQLEAVDTVAGLTLRTEIEALPGGAIRARHTLSNTGRTPYLLEGLEITLPLSDAFAEMLDFTGRHERERVAQRQPIRDGLWLRESRHGRPGLDSASVLVAGTECFSFTHGDVVAVHVGWSGNSVLRLERDTALGTTIGGGELLLPGEIALEPGGTYTMPWVYVVATRGGLDAAAAALHTWQRSQSAHPGVQPVTLNVWEAVYFDHDLPKLVRLADLAHRVGVERFVLDDGWFHGRRDDQAGLGDWWVDEEVWPDGLHPLITHVHGLGMQFGLWIEPEMVNPDSELYRAHPDWILATGDRLPMLYRNQLVLDLTNHEVSSWLLTRFDRLLTDNAIDYIKWDHNRDLHEGGSRMRSGAPAVHAQTLAYYALLDELRRRHPDVAWESCAGGGARIDLGVLERVQRAWTSDMTDALARQHIQRWTSQFVAPEYLGAHISAPVSHQTGRYMSLDFRAATAFFYSYGIEWDLTEASDDDLNRIAAWSSRYRRSRTLLHTGRMIRPESSDPAVYLHGVVAADRRSALLAHVQLEESAHNRGVAVRVPHLQADLQYDLHWEGPIDTYHMSVAPALDPDGPTRARPIPGWVLAETGVWMPRRRPQTVTLIAINEARPHTGAGPQHAAVL